MPRNDLVVIAHQDWIGESKPADAIGNLPDLLFRMAAGVLGEGRSFAKAMRITSMGKSSEESRWIICWRLWLECPAAANMRGPILEKQ
jgi:hypothetical protein